MGGSARVLVWFNFLIPALFRSILYRTMLRSIGLDVPHLRTVRFLTFNVFSDTFVGWPFALAVQLFSVFNVLC
jgi:hypothetical protein